MNRQECIKSLGLDLNCSDEALRSKWSKLDSRNRQKLAAASDEASRRKYEEQLSALDEVAAVLWPTKPQAQAAAEEPAVNTNAASISEASLAADTAAALGASPQPDALVKHSVPASRQVVSPLSQTQMRDLPVPASSHNASLDHEPTRIGSDRSSGGVSPLSLTMQADLPAMEQLDTTPRGQADTSPKAGGAMSTDHVGQVLSDRYELRREIGRGGMGVVYAALDRVRGEEIAVKCLAPHLMADEKARQRFAEEARLASKLSHLNVVRVFDLGESDGISFLTMELLQGRSLREDILQRKDSHKRFTVDEVRAIGRQLCDALGYAHQQQLIHRDVKPENIWLCEDGTVKLMDFGIARLLSPSKLFTTNMQLGTAYYMAPEQLRGDANIDHRADQFALAVVLYEMLTGQVPQGAIRPPHEIRGGVPIGLSRSVMKALAGDTAQRHRDMRSLSEELGSNPTSVWHRRKWIAVAAVCGVLLLASPWYWNSLMSYVRTLERQSVASTSVESSVTKADLARKLGQIEELRQKADGIGKEIEQVAKNARKDLEQWESQVRRAEDGSHAKELDFAESNVDRLKPQVELAELCLALWKKHATFGDAKRNWYATAMGHIEAAREFVKDGLMPEAATELSSAETLLQTPIDWYANALEGISKWRDLCSMLDSASQSGEISEQFLEYPVQQCQTGFDNLRIANGANGLEQLARLITEFRKLKEEVLPKREKLIAVASDASIIERMKLEASDALLKEYQAATSSVLSIDRAIREGRYDDAMTAMQPLSGIFSKLPTQVDVLIPAPFDATSGPGEQAARKAQKAWANFLKVSPARENSIGMTLVLVPPGEFEMVKPQYNGWHFADTRLKARLTGPCWLGRTEVTQGQWKAVMKTEPWKGQDDVRDSANCPVTHVSWLDAVKFCNSLSELEGKPSYYRVDGDKVTALNNGGYRLPTEAEWEYACRAGTRTAWSFGEEESRFAQHAWYNANTFDVHEKYAHRVSQKRPNGFGLHDMHGNVQEWCWDRYNDYPDDSVTPRPGRVGDPNWVIRGGSWRDDPSDCRAMSRSGEIPSARYDSLGFRLALSHVE